MRVAFFSDIHANLPALRAALESAARHRVDRIVVAGDAIGSGPHPVEVIRALKERRVSAILGNVERRVLAMRGRDKTLKKHLKKKKSAHLAWTANQLDSLEWEWLESLSDHQLLSVRETRILIVHGSGVADDDYIFPSITAEGLKSKIMGAGLRTFPYPLHQGGGRSPGDQLRLRRTSGGWRSPGILRAGRFSKTQILQCHDRSVLLSRRRADSRSRRPQGAVRGG
jgi:predicted phosphodiesterase